MKPHSYKEWTIRERSFVERNYKQMESTQIAQALGRPVVSVKRYINTQGFRKHNLVSVEQHICVTRNTLTHLQGMGDYTLFHALFVAPVQFSSTISRVCEQAPHLRRVHRSWAVNLDRVARIEWDVLSRKGWLVLSTSVKIPVSHQYWKAVRSDLSAMGIEVERVIN